MVRHIRTHTRSREKPFWCKICEYSSRTEGHLADHMKKIHEREKLNFETQRKEEDSYLFGREKNSNVLYPVIDFGARLLIFNLEEGREKEVG